MNELRQAIFEDWPSVTSAKNLRDRLTRGADALESLGWHTLAAKWRERLSRMPNRRLGKEAINIILLSASKEITERGIIKAGETA